MRRINADKNINYPRACVIKSYLVRNLGKEVPMSLDPSRSDPSYRLGRLFAALEKTQRDALGSSIGATVRDRFYSSASATPSVVFPRMLRTYQHHLAKLEGGKVSREKLVQEIVAPLQNFPAHLDLAEQGQFALGYYHQMNDFYRPHSKQTEDK
jgi:CRISPR-associated protein Csd1